MEPRTRSALRLIAEECSGHHDADGPDRELFVHLKALYDRVWVGLPAADDELIKRAIMRGTGVSQWQV